MKTINIFLLLFLLLLFPGLGYSATNGQIARYDSNGNPIASDDLISITTLSGVTSGSTHLGTFTGSTITDSSTNKVALQELETAVEASSGTTNLSNTSAATTLEVHSSSGTDTTLPAATTSNAGMLTGADKTKLDGITGGADSLQFIFTDLTETYTGKYIEIHSAVSWTTANILCDVAETAAPIEFDIYMKTSISGTASAITTTELTMSTTNAYVADIDISGLTDPSAGSWIRVDIATIADTATECTVSLNL